MANIRKAALIGCGGMGMTHSRVCERLFTDGIAEITAVADADEKKLEIAGNVWPEAVRYRDGMELLEKESLDLVHICLPTVLHMEYAKAALQKGIPVFVEKPVCLSEDEADELLEVQKQYSVPAMTGHVVRYMPEYQFLKNASDSGIYGVLKSISMKRLNGRQVPWFYEIEKSGSVVLDLQIHDIDFITWIKGLPEQIHPLIRVLDKDMQHAVAALTYGDCLAQLEGQWDAAADVPFHAAYRASFEEATVVYDGLADEKLVVYHKDGSVEYPEMPQMDDLYPYETEIRNFHKYLDGSEECMIVTLKEAVDTLKIALKIRDAE